MKTHLATVRRQGRAAARSIWLSSAIPGAATLTSQLRLHPPRGCRAVVVLLAGFAIVVAACTAPPTPSLPRPSAPPGGPAALATPAGRLVDRPVASRGCSQGPAVQPGATALVRVAVPPTAAAGARQRVFWLHVPTHYSPDRPVPLV